MKNKEFKLSNHELTKYFLKFFEDWKFIRMIQVLEDLKDGEKIKRLDLICKTRTNEADFSRVIKVLIYVGVVESSKKQNRVSYNLNKERHEELKQQYNYLTTALQVA